MSRLASGWDRTAGANPSLRFVDANLRGAAQVMLQSHPVTGLLILVAIAWGAAREHTFAVFVGAAVGLVVGTTTALLLRVPESSWRQGLYGFSPLLTGAALPTFLANRWLLWVCLVLATAITTVVTLALSNVFKTWGVPALTFPFVLTTWFLLMGAYQFFRLRISTLTPPALPAQAHPGGPAHDFGFWAVGMLKGVAQVFLINDWISGIVILVALLVSSRWSCLFAILGTVVATLFAAWLGVNDSQIHKGLWSFSAVLTAIALGAVLYHPSLPVLLYALLGILATVFVQGGLTTMLAPLGVPTLTGPFVFATWLFLLPKRGLEPIPQHLRIGEGLLSDIRRRF